MLNDAMRSKIAALLAKTVDNGCTEAEALAAANALALLLKKHGVTLKQVREALKGGRPVEFTFGVGGGLADWWNNRCWFFVWSIARFFDVGVVSATSARKQGIDAWGGVVYFGAEADVAAAVALTRIACVAVQDSWQAYKLHLKAGGHRFSSSGAAKIARTAFYSGFSDRVSFRLDAMKNATVAGTGALVVAKRDLLVQQAHARKVRFTNGTALSNNSWDYRAEAAGNLAGELAPLGAEGRVAPSSSPNDAADEITKIDRPLT